MEKLKKKIRYKQGLFNSKNDKTTVEMFAIVCDKLNETIDELNDLKNEFDQLKKSNPELFKS